MMLHLYPRDRQSVEEWFKLHPKTVHKLNPFIKIKVLAELTAVSIDNGFPLSAIYYDQYTESQKSLSQFAADSTYLMALKDTSETIYDKIICYIATFSKWIYSPLPINNPLQVVIKDDLSIYMNYIIAIYKALVADNQDIDIIRSQKPQQLVSNNHYQIDVRFIPNKLCVMDSNEELQSFIKEIKELSSLDTSQTVVEVEEETNLEISTCKTRSEGLKKHGQEHLLKSGLDTIQDLNFIRNLKDEKRYRRFEVIIDRHGKDTMRDNIYKFVPLNKNYVPLISLDNGSICKIQNSKGVIIPGKLRAEDEGILTMSFHVTPQCIKMYLLYGCGKNHLIGSRVFPENLRQKLDALFYGNTVISKNQIVNDCHDLNIGDDKLHLTSRKLFGNDGNVSEINRVPTTIVTDLQLGHQPLIVLNTLECLSSKEHSPCSFQSRSIYSSEPSPSPIHPIHEAIKQKLIQKLKGKGALTQQNLDLAMAVAQKQYKQRNCTEEENTPDPRITYHLLPDSENKI